MASNGVLCLDNITEVDVNFNGLNIGAGSIVSAWDDLSDPEGAIRTCITLTGNTSDPSGRSSAVTEYNSCFNCFLDNYTIVDVTICGGIISYSIPLSNFTFIPTENQAFFLEINTESDGIVIGCFEVVGVSQISKSDFEGLTTLDVKFLSTLPFPDCETCASGFTSGNESIVCNVCWDGTGYTTTTVTAPHPQWTNQFGQTVSLLDAIQLGGMNGLNN
jgi:hypothetical protein